MGSLLVVTGPPGSGKSTISPLLADRFERSVLVTGDSFYDFLAAGAIEPWLPESADQNAVVAEAAARATGRFAVDYDVIYDGVLGPWQLDAFMRAGEIEQLDYAVLLPPVEVTVDRVATRTGHLFTDESAARHMHAEFAAADLLPQHVFGAVLDEPAQTVALIDERRSAGELRVTAAR